MKKQTLTIAIAIAALASCTEGNRQNDMEFDGNNITTEMPEDDPKLRNDSLNDGEKKGTVKLTAIQPAKPVPGASLKVLAPGNGAKLQPGKVDVKYQVDGFELGANTALKTKYDLAESEKGQHIHAIVNNEPYMAHYDPTFSKEFTEGQYLMMSFLSRSYHLSLKEREAGQLIQFTVGNPQEAPFDLNQPFLFYSRPKGTYDLAEHSDILLDFYLENCTLSETGFKIKAKIAGFDFTLDSWQPYVIQGLEEGLHSIRLELVDGNGNTVPSPFNPVTRNIEVKRTGPPQAM